MLVGLSRAKTRNKLSVRRFVDCGHGTLVSGDWSGLKLLCTEIAGEWIERQTPTVAAQTGTSLAMIEKAYLRFIPSALQEKLALGA